MSVDVAVVSTPAPPAWLSDEAWAQVQGGGLDLGDPRRTRRALALGQAMLAQPAASLPQPMAQPAALSDAYALLNNPTLSLAKLSQDHWAATRQTTEAALVWQLQATTEVDSTPHPPSGGLGPIGDGRGRGLLLPTVWSVAPSAPLDRVLGVAHQQGVLRPARQPAPPKPKWTRTPESLVWETAVAAVDTPPIGVRWVHGGDRAADNFALWLACRPRDGVDFLVRRTVNRVLAWDSPPLGAVEAHRLDYARALPAQGATWSVAVAATPTHPARTATVQLGWVAGSIVPPADAPPEVRAAGPLDGWGVRVWEADPPDAVVEPLGWVVLSRVAVTRWAEAVERVDWYRRRWVIEDYHKCLKTGCRLAHTQLDQRADIERLLGFVGPIAARLLQLRQLARHTPRP